MFNSLKLRTVLWCRRDYPPSEKICTEEFSDKGQPCLQLTFHHLKKKNSHVYVQREGKWNKMLEHSEYR